jgi:hypothetical protein
MRPDRRHRARPMKTPEPMLLPRLIATGVIVFLIYMVVGLPPG